MDPRPRRLDLSLTPLHQIDAVDVDDGAGWLSTGEDPQFELRSGNDPAAVAPGWYRLSLRVRVAEGFVIAPCLYPDYGEGLSEATRIDLPEPDPDGWIHAILVFPARLRFLRFDPTLHRARFGVERLQLQRIGRLQAATAMIRTIAGRSGDNVATAAACVRQLVAALVRGRVGHAAQALVARYQDGHRRADRGYAEWLRLFAAEAPPAAEPMPVAALEKAGVPLISLLLPVHNTPPRLLQACVESVIAQSWPHWELCIADDASTDPDVLRLIEGYVAADRRIRIVCGERQAGISANTNRALGIARGRFVGFLDHDDELAADALQEIASAIDRFPAARLFYTDEDKIDDAGNRHAPHFKPAWNPDLLTSLNYICHLMVVETALVHRVGRLRSAFDGAQDHDLALRCTETLDAEQIVHIPKVLYHWRATAGSTALGAPQKPYVLDAGRRAVADHLARTGVRGEVHLLADGRYRVERALPAKAPHVVVVVPTRDRVDLLQTCVDSVLEHTDYPSFEIVIVDNGSTDPATRAYLAQAQDHPAVSVLDYPAPFNFSDIVNRGVRAARGDVVCLLNNDIEAIHGDWLREMASHAVRPEVGIVGAMLYYPNDTIQHAGVILGIGGVAGHSHCRLQRGADGYISRARVVQNLSAVTAACMVFRRDVFERVGGFDDRLAVAFNDIDFCMRVRAMGYLNVWTPFAELYHHESASRGTEDTPAKQARFAIEADFMKRRWGGALAQDPSYNPNLSLDSQCFELAFPPRELDSRISRLEMPSAA
ncbi:glycosyltransferase [Lysobacter humi (ex Lee et al. 2017)]